MDIDTVFEFIGDDPASIAMAGGILFLLIGIVALIFLPSNGWPVISILIGFLLVFLGAALNLE